MKQVDDVVAVRGAISHNVIEDSYPRDHCPLACACTSLHNEPTGIGENPRYLLTLPSLGRKLCR